MEIQIFLFCFASDVIAWDHRKQIWKSRFLLLFSPYRPHFLALNSVNQDKKVWPHSWETLNLPLEEDMQSSPTPTVDSINLTNRQMKISYTQSQMKISRIQWHWRHIGTRYLYSAWRVIGPCSLLTKSSDSVSGCSFCREYEKTKSSQPACYITQGWVSVIG
jgi:hypothetical protein